MIKETNGIFGKAWDRGLDGVNGHDFIVAVDLVGTDDKADRPTFFVDSLDLAGKKFMLHAHILNLC
jgi:hypothetical protein